MAEASEKKRKSEIEAFLTSISAAVVTGSANASRIRADLDNLIGEITASGAYYTDSKEFYIPLLETLERTRDVTAHLQKKLAEEKKHDVDYYAKTVGEYDCLIHEEEVSEGKVHEFFEVHPNLLDPRIVKLDSKKSFGGEKFPDFIITLSIEKYVLVEIEKPSDSIYKKNGDPSLEFNHAEQQIRDYLQWANEEKDWLRKRGLPKMSTANMKGLVVIGLRSNMSPEERERFEQHNFSVRATHEIRTFDDILMEHRQLVKNLRTS